MFNKAAFTTTLQRNALRFTLAIIAVFTIMIAPRVSAAPVWGKAFQLRQPDGSFATVKIWGDEFYQIVESLDEYTLIRDPQTQDICYADLSADGNDLISTRVKVEKTKPARLKLNPHLSIKPESRKKKVDAARAAWDDSQSKAPNVSPAPLPGTTSSTTSISPEPVVSPGPISSGSVQGICLLIDFSDDPATIPAGNAASLCNQAGYTGYGNNGSVHDYYYDISDGRLNYTNYVMPTYYRAAHPKTYYDDPTIAYPQRARELIIEALNYLENSGFDFSLYDIDHDGRIDALNCFYAGTTSAGWSKGLWPHKSSLTWGADGVSVGYYQISDMGSSLEIGTFCHENGHMLMGWPDLYDYGYESKGTGNYCLMSSSGSTNPVEPCAYLKLLAGWANLTVLSTPLNLQLRSGLNDVCKYPRPGLANEYYLIENRQNTGRDANLPDAGLAVWHIDTNGSNDNEQMTSTSHYKVTLVQADGRWDLEHNVNYGDSTDLFDSGSYKECSPYSMPNTNWWDGSASGLDINHVSASGATMTFNFMEPYTLGVTPRDGLTASGIKGQAFSPNYKTFTLNNSGDISITWTATKTAAWLNLSKTGGNLAPGQTDTVTVSINSSAGGLNTGTYTDKVIFTDQATQNKLERQVTLIVTDFLFAWDTISSPQSIDNPFPVKITAMNSQGVVHQGFTGTVNLNAFTGGTSQIGTGTTGWNYPLGTLYHDARLQVIYLASEIGRAGPISSLSLDVATIPGQVLNNWTIRMKHTTLSAYSSAAWESSGWTTVYQANQSITQTGWVRFDFPTPFTYNGTQNLMIDFSFNNSSYTADGSCRYSTPGGNRSCYYRCDSTFGDPLTWSGTTPIPTLLTKVPNIKLAIENPVNLSPTVTGNFVQGVWTGQVKILENKTGVALGANDGQGHSGNSNKFDISGPFIKNVTSRHANGSFTSGEVIDVDVLFSTAVVYTGTPKLELALAGGNRLINCLSGNNTTTLTFRYTVQPGDTSADLDYATTAALTISGGSIRDLLTNSLNAQLALPAPGSAGSLGANRSLRIDTTAPTVTVSRASSQPDPAQSEPIHFTATFSEPVQGFDQNDVTLSGTAGGTKIIQVTGGPAVYDIVVSGMTSGTVSASIPAGVCSDLAGNTNLVSNNINNSVAYEPAIINPTLTVTSVHGTPNPAVGAHIYTTGTLINASVLGSPEVDTTGTTRFVATGWSGTGSVAATGATTQTSFNLGLDSSITWNWKTQYRLAATATPTSGGQVFFFATSNPADNSWLDAATSTVLWAVPKTDWVFDGWSGDRATTNTTISLNMTHPYNLVAHFIQKPLIMSQPTAQTVMTGDTAGFIVDVAGVQPLSYRWRKNGIQLSDDGRTTGTLTYNLKINSAIIDDSGQYDCVISNRAGSTTSQKVLLDVKLRTDAVLSDFSVE